LKADGRRDKLLYVERRTGCNHSNTKSFHDHDAQTTLGHQLFQNAPSGGEGQIFVPQKDGLSLPTADFANGS